MHVCLSFGFTFKFVTLATILGVHVSSKITSLSLYLPLKVEGPISSNVDGRDWKGYRMLSNAIDDWPKIVLKWEMDAKDIAKT